MSEQTVENPGTSAVEQTPKHPEVLSLGEAKRFINAAWRTPHAAYFVLRLWAAVRPAELQGLDVRKNLDLEAGRLGITGNGSRRWVALSQTAVQMLKVLRSEGRLPEKIKAPTSRVVKQVMKAVGEAGQMRNLRATAIAYHYAQNKNAELTSHWAGISTPLLRHFYMPVASDAAAAFWCLLPDSVM